MPAKWTLPDFDLGAFHHDKRQGHGVGRDIPRAVPDGGKHLSVRREHILQDHLGPLDGHGIILGLDGEAHLAFLEFIQYVRLLNAVQSLVIDAADQLLFPHKEGDDLPALFGIRHFQPNVVEVAGVPERHEVPPQGVLAIYVAGLRENASPHDRAGNAPVPSKIYALYRLLGGGLGLRLSRRGGSGELRLLGRGRRLGCFKLEFLFWSGRRCL